MDARDERDGLGQRGADDDEREVHAPHGHPHLGGGRVGGREGWAIDGRRKDGEERGEAEGKAKRGREGVDMCRKAVREGGDESGERDGHQGTAWPPRHTHTRTCHTLSCTHTHTHTHT